MIPTPVSFLYLHQQHETTFEPMRAIPILSEKTFFFRSAKLPIFSGESRSSLEERIKQAHQLVGHSGATTTAKPNNQPEQGYTVIHPSFPPSPLALWKRTYSNCSLSSKTDRTITTVASSDSHSITGESVLCGTDEFCSSTSSLESISYDPVVSSATVAAASTDHCDWGYFVDVKEEDETRQQRSQHYRPFLSDEIRRITSLKRR